MAWVNRYVSPTGAGLHDGTSPADAWTFAEMLAQRGANQKHNIIAGTYPTASANPWYDVGPEWFSGYRTTAGDLDDLEDPVTYLTPGTDIPHFTASSGGYYYNVTGNTTTSNLAFESSGTVEAYIDYSRSSSIHRCWFKHTGASGATHALRLGSNHYKVVSGSVFEVTSTTMETVKCQSSFIPQFFACKFIGGKYATGTGSGSGNNMRSFFTDCIFSGQNDAAIYGSGAAANVNAIGCTFYDQATVFDLTTAASTQNYPFVLINNLFHTATSYAIDFDDAGLGWQNLLIANNAYYDINGVGSRFNGITHDHELDPIVEPSDPCVDAANGNFTIKPTANCFGKRFPRRFMGSNGPLSYGDVGAVQSQSTGGSSGRSRAFGSGGLF